MSFSCGAVPCQQRQKFTPWVMVCLFFCCAPAAYSQKSPDHTPTTQDAQRQDAIRQTNERIAQLAMANATKQSDYVIGSGDLLAIDVFDVPELSREVRVNESGLVSIPLVPVRVQAAGLTTFQFQDKLSELLQVNGLVSHPQITVTVKEQHSAPITIIGAVVRPVVIQAVRRTTLLEALSQAGGVASDAGNTIMITRSAPLPPTEGSGGETPHDEATAAGPTITIDLNQLLDSGDSKYNIPLMGGDVVTVPRGGVIYAVGAVGHPGGFVMGSDHQQMTVLKVLSLSGGLTATAKGQDAVIVRQDGSGGDRQEVPIDLRKILAMKAEDVPLRQSDILFVPDSASKHAWRKTAEIAISLATGAAIVNAGRL